MKPLPIISHPDYSFGLPTGHRFPMGKFAALREYLANSELWQHCVEHRPGPCRLELIEAAHDPAYVKALIEGRLSLRAQKRSGLPWSPELLRRTLLAPSGTLLAAQWALQDGIACHLAGGTHHAHADFAAGFCLLNDLAITAKAMLKHPQVNRILIFDCDVHQGDGTARILANEPNAVSVSIHCENNYPFRRAQSDLDVELPAGCDDARYLTRIEAVLSTLLEQQTFDLVLYDAGVDVYEDDPLGQMSLSLDGIAARDALVIEHCRDRQIPIATVIGGGYGRDLTELSHRHSLVVRAACQRLLKEQAAH